MGCCSILRSGNQKLIMENWEWRIIKNTPFRMDFNSQFSILNSFPSQCLPNAAIAFPKACDPIREDDA